MEAPYGPPLSMPFVTQPVTAHGLTTGKNAQSRKGPVVGLPVGFVILEKVQGSLCSDGSHHLSPWFLALVQGWRRIPHILPFHLCYNVLQDPTAPQTVPEGSPCK